ncbi:hypothetical protein BDZ89DRAFT_1109815 [Hymenopellis radicata]|nr:hypothetical protein BDZ89DRAFT_1109815 [Hymenopellis radicata]
MASCDSILEEERDDEPKYLLLDWHGLWRVRTSDSVLRGPQFTMTISRLLVRQPLRVGNQIRGKPSVRVRLGLVDARRHHLAPALDGSKHVHASTPAPRSTTLLPTGPNPAKIANSLHVLAQELAKILRANPTGTMQADIMMALLVAIRININTALIIWTLDAIKEDLKAMREDLNAMKGVLKGMNEDLNAMNNEIHLVHMRNVNGHASGRSSIRYPYPFVAGGPLPRTLGEARNLRSEACAAALNALDGAPGLHPLPATSSAASRKQHLLNYLGIYA